MPFSMRPKGAAARRTASRAAVILTTISLWLGLAACTGGTTASGFVPSPGFDTPHPVTAGPSPTISPLPAASTEVPALDESPTATLGVLPTSGPTVTPPATLQATFTPGTPCANQTCATAAGHFWLDRPIPSDGGYVNYVDRSYPYGSTQGGLREPHHGVEFFNSSGTPIIAAAAGEVVVAGQDLAVAYGPATDFYGRLVVVQLDQLYQGQPVFNLYGHMLSIRVAPGDHVQAGDTLGAVGSTGVAIGPHLHFEVRVGRDDYTTTRNPELWLKPLTANGKPWGAIAGRVVDLAGNLLPDVTVAIKPIATTADVPHNRYISTYALDPNRINGDDQLQENFAIDDMPPGPYSVSVSTSKYYQQSLTVIGNQVAWITFVVKPPELGPTVTPGGDAVTDPASATANDAANATANAAASAAPSGTPASVNDGPTSTAETETPSP
jgi:murein DD-endopeptidase MepM/ murein hydrolase activator NlpD